MINCACLQILHEYASDSALRMNLKVRVRSTEVAEKNVNDSELCQVTVERCQASLVTSPLPLQLGFRLCTWLADLYYVVDQP